VRQEEAQAMKHSLLKIAAACAAVALLPIASASATSFPVANTNDSGAGSLRQAIADANGNAGLDQIPISATGTIQLASVLPDISQPTQISGPGAASLTVRRNGIAEFPIFTIATGATSVELSGLTISNGASPKSGGGIETALSTATTLTGVVVSGNHADGGGGIGSQGSLTLNDTTVSGNTSASGGGGISGGPSTILTHSVVSGNTASLNAGGIVAPPNATLALTDSTVTGNDSNAGPGGGIAGAKLSTLILTRVAVTDNDAVGPGGGLSIDGLATITDSEINGDNDASTEGGGMRVSSFGDADLIRSSVTENDAASNGGGISNQGDLTLTGVTVEGNESGGVGGGMLHQTGDLTVSNSTFAGNQADGSGGGIATVSGTTSINSTTIVGNAADIDGVNGDLGGGGIAEEGPGTPVVSNTLIASNTVGQSQPATQCYGDYFSGGFNLRSIDDTGCTGFTATGDIVNGTPLLGTLSDQGGPTLTVPLLVGSPAIDAGNPASFSDTPPACPATDQRGLPRGGGAGRCDIGAFEVQPQVTPPSGGSPAATPPSPTAKRKKCKKKKKKRAVSAKKCKKRKK
jgi:hypothetical protein